MRCRDGMTSSSHGITTTARNSGPLARRMVLTDTLPPVVSTSRIFRSRRGPIGRGSAEDTELVRRDTFLPAFCHPSACSRRSLRGFENGFRRSVTVCWFAEVLEETGRRIAALERASSPIADVEAYAVGHGREYRHVQDAAPAYAAHLS
jgi:hypothetical protein